MAISCCKETRILDRRWAARYSQVSRACRSQRKRDRGLLRWGGERLLEEDDRLRPCPQPAVRPSSLCLSRHLQLRESALDQRWRIWKIVGRGRRTRWGEWGRSEVAGPGLASQEDPSGRLEGRRG